MTVMLGKDSWYSFAGNRLDGKKVTMPALADALGRFLDRPVVDMTGVKGGYDLSFALSPEDYRAMLVRSAINGGVEVPPSALRALDMYSGDSLTSALEKVGLKLESRKLPVDVLVVDQIEKSPTEN